jgi:hypothetical protein
MLGGENHKDNPDPASTDPDSAPVLELASASADEADPPLERAGTVDAEPVEIPPAIEILARAARPGGKPVAGLVSLLDWLVALSKDELEAVFRDDPEMPQDLTALLVDIHAIRARLQRVARPLVAKRRDTERRITLDTARDEFDKFVPLMERQVNSLVDLYNGLLNFQRDIDTLLIVVPREPEGLNGQNVEDSDMHRIYDIDGVRYGARLYVSDDGFVQASMYVFESASPAYEGWVIVDQTMLDAAQGLPEDYSRG